MKDILLIEASAALLASRLRTLRSEGYHVAGVSAAAETARLVQYNSYDLIILDEGTPEIFEILKSTTVPTLIMASEEDIRIIASEHPMGMWTLLSKPFTAAQLRQTVAEAFKRTNAVKDVIQQRVLLSLNNGSKLPTSEAEMDKYLSHILEIIAAETEADGVATLLTDEKPGHAVIKASLGIEAGNTDTFIELSNRVMRASNSLMVSNRREVDPDIRQMMNELGAWSLLAVPLLTREKAIGAVCAYKKGTEAQFSFTSLEFVSLLAKRTASAIENANLFKNVETQRKDLEQLLERAIHSQENERKRVAVEIHDGIGQQLVGALYRIQAFTLLLTQEKYEDAAAEAEDIRHLLEKTIGELRQVLAGLNPHNLEELGLTSALRQEVDLFTRDTKTECEFVTEGSPSVFTSSQEAAVYRVVQEALNNIRKHARATKVGIKLQYTPNSVSVEISDNGRGFRVEQANNGIALGHIGLAGMKERAEMLGGNLKINSSPGKGTLVLLTIPLTKRD
jgi:signal transduction histidine kinase